MSDFLPVLLLAVMAAAGVVAGGLAAEVSPASRRTLSYALHAAVGVGTAVVAVELMPTALGGAAPAWAVVLALCLGAAFYMVIEWIIDKTVRGGTSSWKIYVAVAADLFSDGLMIGAGAVVSFCLAMVLAVGQTVANIPQGYAALSKFQQAGGSRWRRILITLSFALPALVAATAGYWLLRDQDEAVKLSALAFTAGILLVATIEEIAREADEMAVRDTRWAAAFVIGGFALFTLVAKYLDAG